MRRDFMEIVYVILGVIALVFFSKWVTKFGYCQSCGKPMTKNKMAKEGACPDCGGSRWGRVKPRHVR
jgi:predicted RNA-binding Zn-ribbon protein involved in translation (DUF1610 family)